MKRLVIRGWLQLRLFCLTRQQADRLIRREADRSLALLDQLSPEAAGQPVRVAPLIGVDEEMRDWSLHQILEHNSIVNRLFSEIILCLSHGEKFQRRVNPKTDVMPSANPGPESVETFKASVEDHLAMIAGIHSLRGTPRHPHPVCGLLDAHGWHGFFGLHLGLHRAQMEAVRSQLLPQTDSPAGAR